MYWYLKVLKKYAVFSGRARRKEYWMFVLFNTIITFALGLVAAIMGSDWNVLSDIYQFAIIIPTVAVGFRRVHDTNRSGWWWFLVVPLFFNGHPNDNYYGPDPKADALGNEDGQDSETAPSLGLR